MQSVFCSEKAHSGYLVQRTKYVASAFLQLYDMCFTKILLTVGLVQIDLLVLLTW